MIPVERLDAVPYLAGVPAELRQRLAEKVREESAGERTSVFKEGDPGESIYFIIEGRVAIQKTLDRDKGTFKTLAILEAGDFFGEMALLDRAPRSAAAIALSPVRLLALPVREFGDWLSSEAQVPLRLFLPFFQAMSGRLRETTREMTLLFEIGRVLVRDLEPSPLAAELLPVLARGFDESVAAAFYLWDEFSAEYALAVSVGPWPEEHRRSRRATDPVLGAMAETGECFVVADFSADERFAGVGAAWPSFRSFLAAPVPGESRPVGYVVFGQAKDPGVFTASHRRLLAGAVNLVAPAFESAQNRVERRAQERLHRARQGFY